MPLKVKIALVALAALLVASVGASKLQLSQVNPKLTAANGFSFNWAGTPSTPEPWLPGSLNDWDAFASSDVAADATGTMQAQHGTDCSAPPATHQINQLAQAMYICNNHMMTALFGGGDGPKDYNAAYFTPNQMVDLSQGTAQVNFQVSTQRQAPRDWWDLWITPYDENLTAPLQSLPAFNGPPRDAIHLFVDNTYCGHWQAYGTASQPWGSMVRENTYTNFQPSSDSSTFDCIEDEANARGDAAPSPTVRSPFELDVSKSHLRFAVVGQQSALVDLNLNLPAAFDHSVVQWGHHSYNPQKDCPGPCGPNTFHWSNVSITPAVPFTIERMTTTPSQSIHDGVQTAFTLPQPAPAGSNLRFIGLGETQVSFDGGNTWVAATLANEDGPNSQGDIHLEQNRNYWTAVPQGTTSVAFRGQPNGLAPTWWVEDPAVWSPTPPGGPQPTPTPTQPPTPTPTPTQPPTPTPTPTQPPTPTPTPTQPPTPTPTPTIPPTPTPTPTPPTPTPTPTPPTPVDISGLPCTVTFPTGPQTGTCSGTFTSS